MNEQREEDWLDAKLRDDVPYIDDDGFTSRVAQQLPVRRQKSKTRAVILTSATVLAAVIAYLVSGGRSFAFEILGWAAVMPLSVLYVITIGCGLLVTALGLYAAITRSRKLRS